MTISAQIIADSISPQSIRLTSLQLRYPKFIHGEFMTHRKFSRNASSSRAIPVERLIQDAIDDTAAPLKWFKNKPGMQGTEEVNEDERMALEWDWAAARDAAVNAARTMIRRGAHKQHINRVIEPFCHINVIVTATDFANFFALRDHRDAQPEICELARRMKRAMEESDPARLWPDEWHLPYIDCVDVLAARNKITMGGILRVHPRPEQIVEYLIKVSVARCARVSYLTHDGKKPDFDADLALYERLVGSVPLHASPAEHQATPDQWSPGWSGVHGGREPSWFNPEQHGNLSGWRQYRKMLPGECAAEAA